MNAKVVMDALRDINRRDGITVLCNLHTLDTARAYCDRIVGMAQGRIVFDGAPERWTRRRCGRSTVPASRMRRWTRGVTSTSIAASSALSGLGACLMVSHVTDERGE